MYAKVLVFIIFYLIAVIPGFVMCALGKKYQGILSVSLTITFLLCIFFIRIEDDERILLLITLLAWSLQFFYMLSVIIERNHKKKQSFPQETKIESLLKTPEKDHELIMGLTSADILKGLLFVVFLWVMYGFSLLTWGLLAIFIDLFKNFPSIQYILICSFLAVMAIVGFLGYGVEVGRPLWMIWKSNIKKNPQDENADSQNGIPG